MKKARSRQRSEMLAMFEKDQEEIRYTKNQRSSGARTPRLDSPARFRVKPTDEVKKHEGDLILKGTHVS